MAIVLFLSVFSEGYISIRKVTNDCHPNTDTKAASVKTKRYGIGKQKQIIRHKPAVNQSKRYGFHSVQDVLFVKCVLLAAG